MAKEKSMAFYVSFYELAKVLPEKSKNKFLASVLEYYFDGIEPSLNANEQRLFEAIRGRIDMAVQNGKNVKSRYEVDESVPTAEPTTVPTTVPTTETTNDCGSYGQSESESESKGESESSLRFETDVSNPVGQNPTERIPYDEIVGYLNVKAGRSFSPGNKATRRHIKARWNEGYRLDDFKRVIDNMTRKWLHKPDMKDYLRPETLFVTKFDTYLNMTPEGGSDDHRFDAYDF